MGVKNKLKSIIKQIFKLDESTPSVEKQKTNTEHWTDHNVAFHKNFKSREDSLEFVRWRNSIYLFYNELMPCSGFDNQIIVDYGCGPGHDTIGFVDYSKPKKVYAVDISATALDETKERMKYHTNDKNLVDYLLIKDGTASLPIETESVDYVHSSGVLHHTPNESEILIELHRILKKGGMARIMMYNYNSLYAMLYVGYTRTIEQGAHQGISFADALRTDSDLSCPIARYYKKEEFIKICESVGFKATLKGVAISTTEMLMTNQIYIALEDTRTPKEIRDFLYHLSFDQYKRPLYKGDVAGIDAVYELIKI